MWYSARMPDAARSPRHLRADRRAAAWLALGLLAVMVAVLLGWAAGLAARHDAGHALEDQARATANLNAALLRTELEKQRSLPFVLAADPDLRDALQHPDPARLLATSRKLERLRDGTGADVIYLIDSVGMTVAASNWRDDTSFVGNDYRFRQYFQEGLAAGAGEHYALGNVSRRPGLYISRRLGPATAPLGVVVVKVEFGAVEDAWRDPQRPVYVADPQGVVLVTNRPAWRFRTLEPLPDEDLTAIRDSLQYGDAPLTPLPLRSNPIGRDPGTVLLDAENSGRAVAMLRVEVPVPAAPWRLFMLVPAEATLAAAEADRRHAVLGLSLLMFGFGGFLLQRAGRTRRRAAAQEAARAELEDRVAARTAELTAEIAGREQTEARLAEARDTLQQANRLATLGQVAAGVAHEINQPVAAIRSYAENAGTFLDRGDTAKARGNLETIGRLCQRIGGITDELRAFSRKGAGPLGPVRVAAAVEGAALLLRARLDQQGVPLHRGPPFHDAWIIGHQVRLEQVLVNLIQNALDALEDQDDGQIHLSVLATGGEVRIEVRDNGPGIPEAIRVALFLPFTTSKPQGLGLGLVICNDIVTEAGGRIEASAPPGGGTGFTIILPEAQP
ncbi:sensor histidine kinase [Roseomonas haemaphysalidis]|nr:ATP-binding protein [Roseomonas haemaphysalidis]